MNLDAMIEDIVDDVSARLQGTPRPHAGAPRCDWCGVCADCRTEVVKSIVESGAERVGASPGVGPINQGLARMIDHTLLKPEATETEIRQLCEEAVRYNFASVCVNACWMRLCQDLLRGSDVLVCTVVGFPLGATSCEAKAFETQTAVEHGAQEIDMVVNVGKLKSGDYDYVERDIRAVVAGSGSRASVKVILETCLLTDEEKVKACLLCKSAGATFVKTSTGFNKGGATLGDVSLMRKVVGATMGVKASGGVRDYQTAIQMLDAGASRIGASASIKIVSS